MDRHSVLNTMEHWWNQEIREVHWQISMDKILRCCTTWQNAMVCNKYANTLNLLDSIRSFTRSTIWMCWRDLDNTLSSLSAPFRWITVTSSNSPRPLTLSKTRLVDFIFRLIFSDFLYELFKCVIPLFLLCLIIC